MPYSIRTNHTPPLVNTDLVKIVDDETGEVVVDLCE